MIESSNSTRNREQKAGESVWAVLPAAGIGARMGAGKPKQYLRIAGRTVLEYACDAFLQCSRVRGLVIALHPNDSEFATLDLANDSRVSSVVGGAERADSVLAALDALAKEAGPTDWVMVHDAARPCLQAATVEELLASLSKHEVGGVLAQPATETIKLAGSNGDIAETLPREHVWLAQTPQVFRYGILCEALRRAAADGVVATDESMAVERLGHKPLLLKSEALNIKVTRPQDLPLAAWYLAQRSVV